MAVSPIVLVLNIPDELLVVRGEVRASKLTAAISGTGDASATAGAGSVQSVRVSARVARTTAPGRQQ